MAISLCSALVLVTLSQAPPLPVAPTDSLATLRGRAAQDSSDAQLWLLMGRAYLGLGVEAHGATHRSSEDSVWTRAVLDTAEEALGRAAALAGPLGSSAVGDSARVFRVGAWAARSWLGWEAGGRSEEHTSELQSRLHLVCRLLLEKKKNRVQHANLLPSQR